MCIRVVLVIALAATVATAELDSDQAYRGMCILSSSVGKGVPNEEIHEFVASCNFDLVVVDFSWITGLWPSTDFAAVEILAAALKKKGVEVVALYRPRVLRPSDADVHFAKDADGKTAPGRNHLCFAHEDSVAWGARWGSEILRRLPSIDKVALYNLWSHCACEKCRDDNWR
ncbi:MAG: hypothetical protein ABFS86_16710, partial [Planctomycetota bacterium]